MSIVVSDTSPIQPFHFIKQISLLDRLFGTVIDPPAVANELIYPARPFEPLDLSIMSFVEVRAPHDQQLVAQYATSLDIGEAEAITLAAELGALLLIDEIDGRAAAAAAGIPFVGVLGVLARAKREGLISEVRPIVDRLRIELRFRIAEKLYKEFLEANGEKL